MHIKNTWGSHCDKLIFMSSQEDQDLGAVALNISEGRQNLWGKTRRGFDYCYQHHREEYDWFLKADDDTFMVIENLKEFLRNFDTNKPIHFGHHFKYLGVRPTCSYTPEPDRKCIAGLLCWRCWLCPVKGGSEEANSGGSH